MPFYFDSGRIASQESDLKLNKGVSSVEAYDDSNHFMGIDLGEEANLFPTLLNDASLSSFLCDSQDMQWAQENLFQI
jgi:hypothetical protein